MSAPLPIEWPSDGLIPAVIQDATTGDVLMVGFMNHDALERTRQSGFVHFWSRSRRKMWKKGETSGHVQRVRDILVNCEQNSLLIEVEQVGAVCHDGYPTCYYRRLEPDNSLTRVVDRWFDPGDVYGAHDGLRAATTLWWGAYEFLRDNDLSAVSGTARRLNDEQASLTSRIADELRELAGVLDGTHRHGDERADLLLEGSQVCYWVVSEMVRRRVSFADVRPDRALDVAEDDAPACGTVAALLRRAATDLADVELSVEKAHALFALVATAAAARRVAPQEIIEHDLSELRGQDYLTPYFSR